jgi:EAL domain-containing protein (putative c-di-GMP-specific phosphodiesterase class I)/FixJ family two-component response regulator
MIRDLAAPASSAPQVYLIDDEPDILQILRDIVELSGFQAHCFSQADDFINEIQCFEGNNILILDLQMPKIDGIEVIRHLAKMENSPDLILMSGQDSSVLSGAENLAVAHSLVVRGTLEKPLSIARLRGLLESQTTIRRAKLTEDITSTVRDISAEELREALDLDQFVLRYQPKEEFALTGVSKYSAECLVRWQHPTQGLIYPDRFVALIERLGWMPDLTAIVFNQAIRQQRQWQKDGLQINLSINVSASDITSLTLPETISRLLADNELDTTTITLEVTESELMGELTTSLDVLTRLRLKGLRLSIDDFGTGYSSLLQLFRMPFSELKIDQSFVSKMVVDMEALAIVKACIALGEQFNMRVVAEGVEDHATKELLAELGCHAVQGYYIAKPMASEDLTSWLGLQLKA